MIDLSDPQVKKNFSKHFTYAKPKHKSYEVSLTLGTLFLGLIFYSMFSLKRKFSKRHFKSHVRSN